MFHYLLFGQFLLPYPFSSLHSWVLPSWLWVSCVREEYNFSLSLFLLFITPTSLLAMIWSDEWCLLTYLASSLSSVFSLGSLGWTGSSYTRTTSYTSSSSTCILSSYSIILDFTLFLFLSSWSMLSSSYCFLWASSLSMFMPPFDHQLLTSPLLLLNISSFEHNAKGTQHVSMTTLHVQYSPFLINPYLYFGLLHIMDWCLPDISTLGLIGVAPLSSLSNT